MDAAATTPNLTAESSPAAAVPRTLVGNWLDLMKFRLSGLVVVTAGAGYLLAAGRDADLLRLLATVLGVFLLSGGACALNQVLEAKPDARMERTRNRPVPAGRVSGIHAFLFALAVSAAGLALLFAVSGPLPGWLGVASAVIYVFLYTPLKRITTLNTLVGAIVGALPPMMGWAAATGELAPGAYLLGTILFVWQIPHFLAIAWLYREDYARGGFRMLPAADPEGGTTALFIVLYSLALLPVSLAAAPIRATGWLYPAGAVALGVLFLALSLRLLRDRSRSAARAVFLASLLYLPLLLVLLAFDPTGSSVPWR